MYCETQKTENTKLWNFNYVYLLCLNAIVTGASYMILPLVSKYAITMGTTLSFAGVIAGTYSVAAMFMRPFAGTAADRVNKKHLMVGATFGMAVSVLGHFLVHSPFLLLLFRFLHGVFFGISGTINLTLTSQFVPQKRLGEGIGYLGMATVLGTAVGPNIGLAIMDYWGIRSSFLVAFCVLLTASCCMTFIRYTPEAPKNKTEKNKKFRLREMIALELLPFSFFGGLLMVTNGIVSSYLVLVGEERGIGNIGLYFTVNAIVMLLSRPMAGKISDRYEISYVLIPAFTCGMLAMFLLSRAESLPVILLVAVLQAFGAGMGHPALQAECIRRLGREHSGVATGTYYLGADLGIGFGPMLGGVIATQYGYSTMYSAAEVLMVFGLVSFLLYRYHVLK